MICCKRCGYAYYGKAISFKAAKGHPRDYAYYRCLGTDAYRFGGERVCHNTQVRTDLVDLAVWEAVCVLLKHPERLSAEYQRRLHPHTQARGGEQALLSAQLGKLRQGLVRLIDSYTEGLLEKREFEPRITRLRDRIAKVRDQLQHLANEMAWQTELQLIIGHVEEFAAKVKGGLERADWNSRREIVRTLVKRVEVDERQVNLVFRVNEYPFDSRPDGGILLHCGRRNQSGAGQRVPALRPRPVVRATVQAGVPGEAHLIRFVDDFVAVFQYQADANAVDRELAGRMREFGLELNGRRLACCGLVGLPDNAPPHAARDSARSSFSGSSMCVGWIGRANSLWCAFPRTTAAGSFWITPMNGSRGTCTCRVGSSRRSWRRCCVGFTSTSLCTTVSVGWTGFVTRSSYSGSEHCVGAASGIGCSGVISRAARGSSCRLRRLCIRRSEAATT